MNTQTFLLIILAVMAALGIVLFQYYYKTKKKGKLSFVLALLRFITFFCIFLLLINPKFTKNQYRTEKASLILLVDNSSSVATFEKDIDSILNIFLTNGSIDDRFTIERYSFGSSLKNSDSLSFKEESTNVSEALSGLREIYSNTNLAVVILSDGNQTLGQDYGYFGKELNYPVYPITIGDTTRYEDIAISQVNTNRYSFLKNKYPIEIYISYTGGRTVSADLKITVNGIEVYKQGVSLSDVDNTSVINTLLDANSVGLKNIVVSVENLENERNTNNNIRETAVEVIDEKTNIAIISDLPHPDIGSLKKAIESNEQRNVSIRKPESDSKDWEDIDLFILYQPNPSFKAIYDYAHEKNANLFTITGMQTNWGFLNEVQKTFTKDSYNQTEEASPILNEGFALFNIGDFETEDFPPLLSNLGETTLNEPGETVLNQQIKGAVLKEPLLAVFGAEAKREAVLFGENSWKWRVQCYRNHQNFKNYDDFIGKIILYLATNKSRERLMLDYESVYTGSEEAKISATYFDKTFVFDTDASLTTRIKKSGTNSTVNLPMLLKGNSYELDLSHLAAGKYDFTVSVKNENLSKSGSFTILDFDVEKQFLSSDYRKMRQLAENTTGELFFPSQVDGLLRHLIENDRFVPIQKSSQNVVSLIDFRILLAILAATLAAEWFIRKYNGLI